MVMQVQTKAQANGRVHPNCRVQYLAKVHTSLGTKWTKGKAYSVSNRLGSSEYDGSDGSCKDHGTTSPETVHFE